MSAYQLPSERNDLVGLFCRTYTCSAAIEKFISDFFSFDKDAGLYRSRFNSEVSLEVDNKQQIVWQSNRNSPYNAFDVVRVYKFGELDIDAKEGTSVHRLPSYKAMQRLCKDDAAVRIMLIKEKNRPVTADSAEWEASLTLN